MKLQRIFINAEASLVFFTTNHFDFNNFNFIDLNLAIPTHEKNEYSIQQKAGSNLELYLSTYKMALQEIFKETPEDLLKAKKRYFYVILISRLIHAMMFFISVLIMKKLFTVLFK